MEATGFGIAFTYFAKYKWNQKHVIFLLYETIINDWFICSQYHLRKYHSTYSKDPRIVCQPWPQLPLWCAKVVSWDLMYSLDLATVTMGVEYFMMVFHYFRWTPVQVHNLDPLWSLYFVSNLDLFTMHGQHLFIFNYLNNQIQHPTATVNSVF